MSKDWTGNKKTKFVTQVQAITPTTIELNTIITLLNLKPLKN